MRKRGTMRTGGVGALGAAALLLVSAPAWAQDVPDRPPEMNQADSPANVQPEVSSEDDREGSEAQVASTRLLTLEEAMERATTRGNQIALAQADVQSAELALKEARYGRLPQVSAEGQYSNYIRTPFIVLPEDSPFGGGVLRTGNKHNFNLSAQVSVPLWSTQLNRSIDLAEASAELSRQVVEASQTTVQVEVQRAYLNGLITLESLEVLEESYETLQKNLELVRARYEQGVAPEYDLIRTEVQVRNVEPELSRALSNHQGALNYIKLLTAIPIDEDIRLAGSLRERFAEADAAELEPNFEQNADLIQLTGQRSLVERQVALEKAAYWPTLAAFGSFTYQGQGNDLKFWDYEWGETAIAGLTLSVPIFSPGLRQRVEQAEVDQLRLGLQEEFLRQSLRSEFEIAQARLTDLEKTIEAQERNVAQAERGYAIAQASYEEGAYGLMEVNDAESALTDARLNYTAALNDYLNAMLDLEELVGAGSENDD
ncbi:TolC family protein [Lujinxingia sediminis]|uniref:TolC family protein n=1 Tax=Lujinxingia sediminis TaxID=2480984 RepID=A0ABY0CX69_9DELT|nr:TolC family protein [Lujinxingia sediminis]RVU48309.1 TolC family protein [Lujinxingia sediminis]